MSTSMVSMDRFLNFFFIPLGSQNQLESINNLTPEAKIARKAKPDRRQVKMSKMSK